MQLADEVLEGRAAVEGGEGVLLLEEVEPAEEADEAPALVGGEGAELGVEGVDGSGVHVHLP